MAKLVYTNITALNVRVMSLKSESKDSTVQILNYEDKMPESIFTERELSEHRRDEEIFVKAAMKGNMQPVLQFWKNKRLELVRRLFDRFESDGREKGVNCV